MNCNLCSFDKPLCKSHIIPEFAYKTLYDSEHRFIEVTDVDRGRAKKSQKGHWDRLLCRDCEQRINEFEKHALKLIESPLPQYKKGSKRSREHPDLSYSLIKLFFLSVMWRSSITTCQTFKHVELGPHEERIRKMIFDGDPGGFEDYGTMIVNLHFEGNHFRDIMVEPTYCRVEGRKCYRFLFSGFLILIFVASHTLPSIYRNLVLSPNRTVTSHDAEMSEFKFLVKTWEKAAETTKDVDIELKD